MNGRDLIYLVDDDEAVLDSLSELLKANGYLIEAFSTGNRFLAAFTSGEAGCVILDINLPDLNGLEIQKRLRTIDADVPVIIVTGYGDVPVAVSAMKAGATDFLEKPYRPRDILEQVARAVEIHRVSREQGLVSAEIRARIDTLTPRENEVLKKLVLGNPNKVVARELGISPRTAEVHRARVMAKMQAESHSHLVRMAMIAGLYSEQPLLESNGRRSGALEAGTSTRFGR